MNVDTQPPNHHADHPGFSGLSGYVAALTMITGRAANADIAIELSALAPGDVLIDIGCGPGAAARRAAARGARVIGLDPSAAMLRVARLLTRARGVRYVDGTAEAIPAGDSSATIVWSLATVHHWRDIDQGLEEARRVLAPGGRFLVTERHRPDDATTGLVSHGWTASQASAFAAACRDHGLTDVRDERRGRLHVVRATR